MTKTLTAFVSVLLLSGTAAFAAEWPGFSAIDTDGNGQIDRIEYQKNMQKQKIDWAPNFAAMDDDSNNGVDESEWTNGGKLAQGYSARCREASASWCKDAK